MPEQTRRDLDLTVGSTPPHRDARRRGLLGRVRQPWVLPVLLGLVVVGLLATSLWMWRRAVPVHSDGAIAVARLEAENFFTLSYQRADQDVERVLGLATEPFRSEYAAQRDAVKSSLVDKRLTLAAEIPEAGAALEYQHASNAQVIVAVNATTTTADGRSETNRYRMRVHLVRANGGWLVSNLTQVG